MACTSAIKEIGGNAVQAPGAASEFARGRQPRRRLDTEEEAEDCLSGPAAAEDPPPASGDVRGAPPERREAATQVSPTTPVVPPGNTAALGGAAAKPKKKANTKTVEVQPERPQGPSRKWCRQLLKEEVLAPEAAKSRQRQSRSGERRNHAQCLVALGSMLRTTAQRFGT